LTTKNIEIIRQFLSPEEPFGPIDASEINDPKALEIIFERHNKIYRALRKRPSLIIGRKGSGKTSYLNSVCFDTSYDYVVSINTSEAFSSVIKSISLLTNGVVFPESVQDLWKTVIYIGLFGEIRHRLPILSRSKALINDYFAKIGLREEGTIDDTLWKIADIISERAKDKNHGILAEILKAFDTVTFKLILKTLESELNSSNRRAVILLDSLDDFQLHVDVVGRAIQGLLKFIGETNRPSARVDIRFCLPAELYHEFTPLSSNPNKDFKRRLLLHWTATELLSLAAHRLILFGQAHQDHPFSILDELESVDNGYSAQVLKKILPTKVTCRLGVDEDPIAYILRHTQLLPRHLLIILNSICNKSSKYPDLQSAKLSEEALRRGIADVEETLVQEIFSAYRSVYPKALTVCKACIPELQHKFSIGDLERVFRQQGKKTMESDDFDYFKRMLIEMGIVGRVINDRDRYIQAEFEYTVPHQLVTSTDDMLCIHPLFTEIFAAKTTHDTRPVYPYGSRIEDSDYRGDDT
jgi:hypothetical protein